MCILVFCDKKIKKMQFNVQKCTNKSIIYSEECGDQEYP